MLPYKIKARLIDREGSLNAVARKLGISKVKLSQTINGHKAHYAVRLELTRRYGIKFPARPRKPQPRQKHAAQ